MFTLINHDIWEYCVIERSRAAAFFLEKCRMNMKFPVKLEKSSKKTFQMLTEFYGDETLSPAHGRSFEHHTSDNTIWLCFTPILRENTLEAVRVHPPLFPFHQPQERTWQLDGYLEFTPAAKAFYIFKHLCLFRDSNPGPTAQHSTSLTTIQDGRLQRGWFIIVGCTSQLLAVSLVEDIGEGYDKSVPMVNVESKKSVIALIKDK
ncbi:hypothetical protein TNCV_3043061 [Trichonephila clavipes]|nr:hypothetical protein TNCV_3043061 [Trichonephila clavipes]